MDDVIVQDRDNKGIIILNRPHVLNALSLPMVTQVFSTLKKWRTEKAFVIMKASGTVAFSVGGDIKFVYETRKSGRKKPSLDLQQFQAAICSLTKNYSIPFIAIINGIVMGAGAGISLHGRYRIATEKAVFAMPETQIGHIPDVGAVYLASRLPGRLGYYLALTGERLKGSDVFRAGIATHYCLSEHLKELEERLIGCTDADNLDDVLKTFCEQNPSPFSLEPILNRLDYCFSAETVEGILARLQEDGSDWAKNTLKRLKRMSPTSLKITLKAVQLGSKLTFPECLLLEYRIVCHCLEKEDFYEGVRAAIIDKDFNPKWKPPTLAEVTNSYVNTYFSKVSDEKELRSKL